MSNAFTNFLKDVGRGIFEGDGANLRDYQHADRMYVDNNYARSPKVGFLYYVVFNINPGVILDAEWGQRNKRDVGLLAKRIDLPKFKIQTETVNQYNRKTQVQTKLNYTPIQVEFHDDNSDITNKLWINYYNYYTVDGVYGANSNKNLREEYGNTKYSSKMYAYGFNAFQNKPFFQSIDIYMLHKGRGSKDFTQMTLVNPIISDWSHDTLNQAESAKVLTNRMTVNYEFVYYRTGKIVRNSSPPGFAPLYYDGVPSPLGVGGSGNIVGVGGIISGIGEIFGENGSLANARTGLDLLGAAVQTKQLAKNIKNLRSDSIKKEGYLIAASAVAGGLATAPRDSRNLPQGKTGIAPNTNSSVNGVTTATITSLTGRR